MLGIKEAPLAHAPPLIFRVGVAIRFVSWHFGVEELHQHRVEVFGRQMERPCSFFGHRLWLLGEIILNAVSIISL